MQKTKSAVIFSAVALLCSSCGTILPDKLWYPVEADAPAAQKERKAEAPKPAPAAEKPRPAAQKEEPAAPLEEGDAVIFGEAPAAKAEASSAAAPAGESAPSPAAKAPAPEKMERLVNPLAMVMPAPDKKPVELPPVEAQDSPFGNNSLMRTFALPFDEGWEKTAEVMLAAPLAVVDKGSGVIMTDWMVQQRAGGGMSLGLFGDGQRVVRYKYAVKLYDRGGNTEVVIIPYTQYTEGRQWLDAKPRRMISEHLMRLIVAKLEGK